jgi:hypothetical protein
VQLLVVMPSGDGVEGFPARVARTVRSLPAADSSGAGLAAAAVHAVRVLTDATRRDGSSRPPTASSDQGRMVLLLGLILAAILVTGTIITLRVFFPPRLTHAVAGETRSARAGGHGARSQARSRRRE